MQQQKTVCPAIFKENTPADYLEAALEAANWIDTLAVKTEHGRIWKALPDGQDGWGSDVPLFTPKCLYDGSAGIGIFLLRLFEATGDERWLSEAKEATCHIVATAETSIWYKRTLSGEVKGIIPVPGWAAGSSGEPTGEAIFAEDLYCLTGDQKWRGFALSQADALLEAAVEDERGIHWSDQEDVTADGGQVIFLILMYRWTCVKKYLEAVVKAVDFIAQDALVSPYGGKFWKLLDLSIIGFPSGTTFPNWSHGTVGTAWMFAALYQDTQDEDYLSLAKAGLEYEMNIAVGDDAGRLIPYQDNPVTAPTFDKYYLSTCHGSAGSTMAFRLLYKITGDELSRGIIRAGAPKKHSWDYWRCCCQCCQTAVMLEHFAKMYEFSQLDEFKGYMTRTADVLLSEADFRTPRQKMWYDSWWRTIPTRVTSYPGLYVGMAGCALSLLSVWSVWTGKKITTQLYEYQVGDMQS